MPPSAHAEGPAGITAKTLLRETQQWHVQPDAIASNATISACGKSQQRITAMTFPREMQRWHMKSNTIPYNDTTSACKQGQQWITATTSLQEMQHRHMKSDAMTYNATIIACEKGKRWITAMPSLRGDAAVAHAFQRHRIQRHHQHMRKGQQPVTATTLLREMQLCYARGPSSGCQRRPDCQGCSSGT